jgi:uncharacterized protein
MTMPPGAEVPPPGSWGDPRYGGDPHYGAGWGAPSSEERTWALVAHVGTFVAAWVAMGFLCPLVVLLVKGNESAFVRRNAVESLNFQISLLIYFAVGIVLAFVLIGFLLLPVIGVFALVTVILATVKASNGEDYRYPLCIRFVH